MFRNPVVVPAAHRLDFEDWRAAHGAELLALHRILLRSLRRPVSFEDFARFVYSRSQPI